VGQAFIAQERQAALLSPLLFDPPQAVGPATSATSEMNHNHPPEPDPMNANTLRKRKANAGSKINNHRWRAN
jgi:hypothetical protein